MPPRSRAKPVTTTRRPRVAGLRTPGVPAGETDLAEGTTAAPSGPPVDDPGAGTAVPAPDPADRATPGTDTGTGTAAATDFGTDTDTDTGTDTDPDTDSDSDTVGGTATPIWTVRSTGSGSTATAQRPGRRSAAARTPAPAATAVEERTPAPAGEPGRFGRATRAAGTSVGRFGHARRALPLTMVVVIVACAVLAGLGFWVGRQAWTEGPVANRAVVDVGGTAELVGQTRESLESIFSYDFARLDDSVDAARTLSTGAFTEQYLSVFDQTIRTPATQQQLRQTATVVNIGVRSIRDDRAEVMALVQFNAERTTTGQSTNAPGLLRAGMVRVDGRWKLAELTPLTASR